MVLKELISITADPAVNYFFQEILSSCLTPEEIFKKDLIQNFKISVEDIRSDDLVLHFL